MQFLQKTNNKKITLISLLLFMYIFLNLLDGERGLISYFKKLSLKESLIKEEKALSLKLEKLEKKNILLTGKIDLDYLEILLREKFVVGKLNEKVYIVD
jgi:cell division protein DivIC